MARVRRIGLESAAQFGHVGVNCAREDQRAIAPDLAQSEEINNSIRKSVQRAIANELTKRDLKFEKDNGQLVFSLFISVDDKTNVTAYTNQYLGSPYDLNVGWGWGYGFIYGDASTYFGIHYSDEDYSEGTLVVDVFSKENKKLIWQGVATKKFERNPKDPEGNLRRVAAAIMKDFPIKPKK
jgi:hypothetical protein